MSYELSGIFNSRRTLKQPPTDKEERWHAESFNDIVIAQFIRSESVSCNMEVDDQYHGHPTQGINISDSIWLGLFHN